MENNSKLLLVHRAMSPVSTEGSIDLLLTSQFYTMRKEKLPIKYEYQAKRIAHSLFEGLLEEDGAYEYFVYREGEEWVFIAYSPEEITAFLHSLNIAPASVRKLFFAQQIASQITQPVILSDQHALTVIHHTATIIPLSAAENPVSFDPDKITLPRKGVRLYTGSGLSVSRKHIWMLSGIIGLLGVLWFIEGVRYAKNNRLLRSKVQEMYAAYPALQSQYQRESIAEKYRTIDKQERQKRYIIGKISGLLSQEVTLHAIEMDKKHYKATLVAKNRHALQRLMAQLKRAGMRGSYAGSENMITVEGQL